jgi:hypothetical protein
LYFVLWVGLYSADFGKSPARLAMDRRISDRGTCAGP